ncbi:hypothetical protein HN385_04935 [archaeon]|jgi:hypothetical protein|nr:hypothetical protein [archaeon]MBT4540812.1 hypothetical protein [Candidatus Woesearchaeota archaeon]MBT3465041.1 hypothetical protein [archaeon]MBT6869286.1 hypothetical protein [archaeon]MBT7381204.1 hypothetical protein [archaeon]
MEKVLKIYLYSIFVYCVLSTLSFFTLLTDNEILTLFRRSISSFDRAMVLFSIIILIYIIKEKLNKEVLNLTYINITCWSIAYFFAYKNIPFISIFIDVLGYILIVAFGFILIFNIKKKKIVYSLTICIITLMTVLLNNGTNFFPSMFNIFAIILGIVGITIVLIRKK